MTQPHRTVPAPTVCQRCGGDGRLPVVSFDGLNGMVLESDQPCPFCCCFTCGRTTSTPPLCADCDKEAVSGS